MDSTPTQLWYFGRVAFDGQRMKISVCGEDKEVPLKSLQVLRELLYRAGELVTKDELVDACWGGEAVSDTVLTTTVGRLRQVLNDDRPDHIETVKGQGYKLVGPVNTESPPDCTT